MYRESDITKPFYYIGEACEIMGISISTFRNYDKKGLIKVHRGSRDRRIIDREDLIAYLKENSLFSDEVEVDERRDIIYTRVSSADQKKNGDLDRQTLWIVENAPQLRDPIILSEVGSGLNDHRKKLTEMIRMIEEDQIRRVYVTYKDRLTRFGYHYLEEMAKAHKTEIIPLKSGADKTQEQELLDDMMSLIASFSGKLYGLRSGKNKQSHERKSKS